MKEYNIKVMVENDRLNLLFECDKDKNTQCNKKYCGTCNHTTDARYIKSNCIQQDKNIIDKETVEKKILDKELEIKINKEDYLIKYNSETDIVMLNIYINKIINEKNTLRIDKVNEFKIINKTRYEQQEQKFYDDNEFIMQYKKEKIKR